MATSECFSHFCVVIKCCWYTAVTQSNTEEKRVYCGLWFLRGRVHCGGENVAARAEKGRREGREGERTGSWAELYLSKPICAEYVLQQGSTSYSFCKPSKQRHQQDAKCSDTRALGRGTGHTSHLNSPVLEWVYPNTVSHGTQKRAAVRLNPMYGLQGMLGNANRTRRER